LRIFIRGVGASGASKAFSPQRPIKVAKQILPGPHLELEKFSEFWVRGPKKNIGAFGKPGQIKTNKKQGAVHGKGRYIGGKGPIETRPAGRSIFLGPLGRGVCWRGPQAYQGKGGSPGAYRAFKKKLPAGGDGAFGFLLELCFWDSRLPGGLRILRGLRGFSWLFVSGRLFCNFREAPGEKLGPKKKTPLFSACCL